MPNRTHIAYLDSIRGLAALTVINEHFVIAYGLPCKNQSCQQLLDYSPLHIWWDGGAAVSMFFVLSGFVLSLKYFRTIHPASTQTFSLIPFITGRIFRIWLPYCVILFISAFLYQHTIETPLLKTLLTPSDWIVNMWRNNPLTLMDKIRESLLLKLPPTIILLPQAWTLTIELVLSLLLPVGLLLAERGTLWLIFFSLLSVWCLDVSPFLMHFLSGLMIARHYRLIVDYLIIRPWIRQGILLTGLFFYCTVSTLPKWFGDIVFSLTQGMGASLIILYALSSIRTQSLLSNSILRQIGKVSYSAYLIHMAILICLTPYLIKGLESYTLDTTWLWLSCCLLTLVIVQLLSLVSYYFLELPSVRLGQKLSSVSYR